MIARLLLSISVAVLPAAARAQSSAPAGVAPDSVTLAQAVEETYKVRPGIIDAQGQLGTADVGLRAAYGAFLPAISGSASGGQFYSQIQQVDPNSHQLVNGDVTSGSLTLGLNASLDLFTGFRRGKLLTAAHATQDAGRAGLDAARAQARLDATIAFYNALAAAELVESRRDGVRRADDQLRIAIARQTTGGGSVSDSLRAFVQQGQAELALLDAETQQAATELTLAQILGRDGRVAARDDPAYGAPSTTIDTTTLTSEAIARAPQVAAADAQAAAARAQFGAARSGYWPTLTIAGGLGYNGTDLLPSQLFQQRQVSLILSVPIFNQFQQQLGVRQSSAVWASAEARAADIRRQVSASVASQVATLRTAAEQVRITKLSAEAARSDLRVQLERYRLGSATTLDVLNSQASVSSSDESALNARFNYLRARAQLEALVGHPL